MNRFAIIVTVKLKPGTAEAFRAHVLDNAAAAVRDEPDCHRFDVLAAEDDADTLFFYEVYTDAASLETHRETPHFRRFREATDDMVVARSIRRCSLLNG